MLVIGMNCFLIPPKNHLGSVEGKTEALHQDPQNSQVNLYMRLVSPFSKWEVSLVRGELRDF